jgi:CDP-glycerol:poly(glycerophosphate) glycerophosphotransferase
MKTIFLSVQTGMVVRDLLRCGPLQRILAHPEAHVVLLTPGVRDPAFLDEFSAAHEWISIEPLEPYAPSTMVWRLMVRRWRYARSPAMADVFHRLEERLISMPAAYQRLFEQYRPSLVVSGDPLRPGDANLIAAARRRGVPSLGSVRSWDNIQKHLRTRPDALTVWNSRNAREAVAIDRYRPWQITEVGAPQLDVYFRANPHQLSKHELGLDPRKKTLLLATSSFTYESDQTYLVDMLIEAIRRNEIRHPLQIVLRLHPDDRVGRYLKYRHAPEVVLDIPERYLATLGWTMTCADLERMAGLVRQADVMVNFATTVTLEAAIVDTPTVLVAFSPIDPEEMQRYVVGLHFRMHYKDLVERDLVPTAWDRAQLVDWINRYLDDPSLYRSQRETIVREWVQYTDGCSGQRLGDAILRQAGIQQEQRCASR